MNAAEQAELKRFLRIAAEAAWTLFVIAFAVGVLILVIR